MGVFGKRFRLTLTISKVDHFKIRLFRIVGKKLKLHDGNLLTTTREWRPRAGNMICNLLLMYLVMHVHDFCREGQKGPRTD